MIKKGNDSILRDIEYSKISNLEIKGKLLDIGGSQKSGYHQLFKGKPLIITANIDPVYGCDLVFDIQNKFPISNKEYDAVTSFNVLEHIYGFHNVFSETNRILKNDGQFIFATPFLFNIHGSPDDYFRYTKSCLVRLLEDNCFKVEKIVPLGYGIFVLIFQICGGIIPTHFLRNGTKNLAISIDKLLLKISSRYRKLSERIPLGYFVIAKKERDL